MFDFIARPFGWILLQFYNLFGSYGVSLILFTVLAKLILLPFQMKSKKGMLDMQRVQPKMKELEKKYQGDKEKYSIAVRKLYKEEGVSMMGGCLPLLLTLPIMLGLYAVVRQPLTFMFGFTADQIKEVARAVGVAIENGAINEIDIASKMMLPEFKAAISALTFVNASHMIDFNFLGLNLALTPTFYINKPDILWVIPIFSGVTSFGYSWLTKKYQAPPQTNQAASSGKLMTYLMPLMSVYIAFIVPAGLGFYWIINNILMLAQEPALNWYYTVFRPYKGKYAKED